jgi:ATP-binding cassette subfamily A (ABC1) protein 3
MDEAEALSRKIGILHQGELKCIGNKQYLKDKFGKGYEIDMKIDDPPKEKIAQMLSSVNL